MSNKEEDDQSVILCGSIGCGNIVFFLIIQYIFNNNVLSK